jgi:hypothetical protein
MTPTRAALSLATAVLLAACGGSDGRDVSLRLVSPDNNIRPEGAECAGAQPFEYLHAGAEYTLRGPDGTVLVEGELPAGVAENADPSIDWGVERIPTVCVMELELTGVPERESYSLQVDPGPPLDFEASLLTDEEPLQLIAG